MVMLRMVKLKECAGMKLNKVAAMPWWLDSRWGSSMLRCSSCSNCDMGKGRDPRSMSACVRSREHIEIADLIVRRKLTGRTSSAMGF